MNKEKELLKNTTIITFGKICTQLVSFFLLPLYTAVLNIEEYGIVDLVITYSSLLLPFVTLALEQALFRFLIDVRNDFPKCREYISTTVIVALFITIITFFFIVVICLFTKNYLFFYFGLVLFASVVSAVALQISRGLGDNISFSLGSTITAIAQIICNIVFLLLFKLGAPGMMLATCVGNVLCGVVIAYRCKLYKYISINACNKIAFLELSKYSLPLIPNQLSWWALNASDKVIVQMFIGVAGNGLIAVATKFSGVYITFSSIFNISWTESVALHIHDEDAEKFISKIINSVFKLFLSACCGIIVLMPFVFPIMINIQFREAYGLIPIFMIASLFNVVVSLYGVIYVAYKQTAEIAKTAVYAAFLNIISHILLIDFVGVYAAALSTMIGYGGMAVYRYFHSRKYINIKLSNKTMMISAMMLFICVGSYYSNSRIIQSSALLSITVMCFYINKEIIYTIVSFVMNKLKGLA